MTPRYVYISSMLAQQGTILHIAPGHVNEVSGAHKMTGAYAKRDFSLCSYEENMRVEFNSYRCIYLSEENIA